MSSMFKKKGGLAFKPKIPAARPRPVTAIASSASAPTPKAVESQPSIGQPLDATSKDASADPSSAPESRRTAPTPTQPSPLPSTTVHATIETHPPPDVPSDTGSLPRKNPVPVTRDKSSIEATPGNDGTEVEGDHASQHATDAGSAAVPTSVSTTPVPPLPLSQTAKVVSSEKSSSCEVAPDAASAPTPVAEPLSATSDPAPVPPTASISPEPVAKQARRKSKRAAVPEQAGDGDDSTQPAKRRRKKPSAKEGDVAPRARTRKRKENNAEAGDDAAEKKKPRKGRSPTPEDAENQVVDLQQLRMADLTKDLRIGKKFSRHDELRDRARKARAKAKHSKEGDEVDQASGCASPAPAKPDDRANVPASQPTSAPAPPASGPQFRIVDGQIVLDQSSLFMDRHARAAAAHAGENMETIEENDFTRLITSSSFATSSKLKGPNIWTDDETELFYRGLRMFGTEFEMISKMFPGKQRRHVKLKFNREERHNPKRIDAALIGEKTIKLDIDEYRAFTGTEFEPVEAIEAEQRKIQEAYEQERQRIADEQAEIMRKKREELFADDDGDEATAGKKKKGGKKRGKQVASYGLNGEPIAQDV